MSRPLPTALLCALATVAAAQDPAPPNPPAPPQDEKKAPPEERPDFAWWNQSGELPYVEGCGVIARDPRTGDIGVIILSSAPGCGAFALAADARLGVAASVCTVDPTWPKQAVTLLGEHESPTAAIDALREASSVATRDRQVLALLGADGRAAMHRGHAVLGTDKTSTAAIATDWVTFVSVISHVSAMENLAGAATDHQDLPLPERLIAAMEKTIAAAPRHPNGTLHLTNARLVSAALLVVRAGAGRLGRDDRLVDLRVDYDNDPMDRLRGLYHVWTKAHLAPTLRQLQRNAPPGSESAKFDSEWLRRIRSGKRPGEK